MTVVLECLGRAISERRRLLKISQEELSTRTGLSRPYLSSVERGKRNFTLGTLKTIARALDVPMHRLIKCIDFIDRS